MASTIRILHRWIATAFLIVVTGVFAAQALTEPPEWVYYLPLPFLFVLMLSGLYMLLRHYRPARSARLAGEKS